MRKILLVLSMLVAVGSLTACNTARGWANGVGKDLSAAGSAIAGTGEKIQTQVPPPQ